MKISINAVCRKDKINKNNTAPVHIRFTQNRQIRYVSTGVTIAPEDWDFDTGRIKPIAEHLKEAQYKIDTVLSEYERKIRRLEALEVEITFDTLFEQNGKRIIYTVADYFNQQIERMRTAGQIASVTKYRFCLVALEKCCPVNIRFEQIDMNYLRRFETYLMGKNASNTVATKLSVLKAVYNRAITDGVFIPKDNPFVRFKVGKFWKPTRKRAITKEDVLKLKGLELSGNNPADLDFARDIFLFSYYTAGINFKDIATLKWNDIHRQRAGGIHHHPNKD